MLRLVDEVDPETRHHAARAAIGEVLQEHPSGTDLPPGSLLTGWVVVTEWMDPDGERWIEAMQAEQTAGWHRSGMLFEALHGWSAFAEHEDD